MKNPWIVIGLITVVLFGGAILISNKSATSSNEGVELLQHIKGNAEAQVLLVEYSDFQCPACGAFQPVVAQVMEEFGEGVSFEYKHFPLSTIHPNALPAALAAEAAGQQGKFFEFHDILFTQQSEWSSSPTANSIFLKYADELDLDVDQFRSQMKSSVLREKIKAEFDEGRELGITGTPTFFLNGEKMTFESYGEFRDQIAIAVDPNSSSTTVETETAPNAGGVKFGL